MPVSELTTETSALAASDDGSFLYLESTLPVAPLKKWHFPWFPTSQSGSTPTQDVELIPKKYADDLVATLKTGAILHRWTANGPYIVDTDVDGIGFFGQTLTLAGVVIYRRVAGTGGQTTVDVHKNGTTIFTTQANRPMLAFDGGTVALGVPDITAIAAMDVLSMDIDEKDTGSPSDLTVILLGG